MITINLDIQAKLYNTAFLSNRIKFSHCGYYRITLGNFYIALRLSTETAFSFCMATADRK